MRASIRKAAAFITILVGAVAIVEGVSRWLGYPPRPVGPYLLIALGIGSLELGFVRMRKP